MSKVLVVHQEEGTRELIKDMILSRGNHEVTTANDTGNALKEVLFDKIEIVIVDSPAVFPNTEAFVAAVKGRRPQRIFVAMSVDDPDDGGDQVDVKFKMMDLHDRLDEILALAKPAPAA